MSKQNEMKKLFISKPEQETRNNERIKFFKIKIWSKKQQTFKFIHFENCHYKDYIVITKYNFNESVMNLRIFKKALNNVECCNHFVDPINSSY